MDIVNWILNIGAHQPDMVCLLVGGLSAYLLTVAIERYFLPTSSDPAVLRAQQGATFLLCWLASAFFSVLMWWALDPTDRMPVRIVVSLVVGIMTTSLYPAIARFLTARYPEIGTAWGKV
jgi:hypothetical protein